MVIASDHNNPVPKDALFAVYQCKPDINNDGQQDYEGLVILEQLAAATSNLTNNNLANYITAAALADPQYNGYTAADWTAYLFDTGGHASFAIDTKAGNVDSIADQHSGFSPNGSVLIIPPANPLEFTLSQEYICTDANGNNTLTAGHEWDITRRMKENAAAAGKTIIEVKKVP